MDRAWGTTSCNELRPDFEKALRFLEEVGRREGLQEGRREGQREGLKEGLLKLLATRFGALPEETRERVGKATLEEIDLWFDRALAGASLGEVFDTHH